MAVCTTPASVPPRLLASTGELLLRVRGSGHDGHLIRIRSPKCTIGSAAGCTLRLRAPGVGPLHCWILRGVAGAVIRRLHGAATLNGAALDDSPLTTGDRLRLGSVELEVVDCCAPTPVGGSSPFPQPQASAAETAELETRLTIATERIARLEAESRQGFQSSIVAADRADQLRDALAAAHQQLEEACRDLAAAQETMTRQTAELDAYRRQLNEIEQEEGELAEQLQKARQAADAVVSERAAREAEAAEAQARLTMQTQRWEAQAAEAHVRLTTQTQRWDEEAAEAQGRLASQIKQLEAEVADAKARLATETQRLEAKVAQEQAQFASQTSRLEAEAAEARSRLASETKRLETEVAESQARLASEMQRWEAEAAEANSRLVSETQRWEAERVQLDRRLQQRDAELEAVRSTSSTSQTGAMTIAIGSATEAVPNPGCDPALKESEAQCAELVRQLAQQSSELETLRRLVGEHTIIEGRLENLEREFDEKCRQLAAAEARSATAVEQTRRQDELDGRARSLAQQEADLIERVARVTETKQQLVREREELTAAREQFTVETANAERQQLAITQAHAESAGQREAQLVQQTAELEKHIEAANTRLAELDALRNQLTGERAALDERAHRMAQRQRELETKEADVQQQWTQIETRRDEASERLAELNARRQELEQQAAAFLVRQQELEQQAAEVGSRQQRADEREQQIEEKVAALERRRLLLEELAENLASQRHTPEHLSAMASQSESSPAAIEVDAPPNVTTRWQPIAGDSPLAYAGSEAPADLPLAAPANSPAEEGAADENGIHDSNNVDLLVSRLVQSGLWRSGTVPAAESAAAPRATVAHDEVLSIPAADEAAALTRPSTPIKHAEGGGEDESIESYMDRLLKRVRGSSPASTPQPPPGMAAADLPPAAQTAIAPPVEEAPDEAALYMPRSAAPELAANLSAMRELANSAARTAIDRHVRKHTGRQAAGRLFAAGLTIATSVLLGYWAWHGHSLQAGVGAGIGGVIGLYWTLAALRRLFGAMRLNRPLEAVPPVARRD